MWWFKNGANDEGYKCFSLSLTHTQGRGTARKKKEGGEGRRGRGKERGGERTRARAQTRGRVETNAQPPLPCPPATHLSTDRPPLHTPSRPLSLSPPPPSPSLPVHLTSRCRVWRFRCLLYFISSSRSGVFLRFFWVVYRVGVRPSGRASVHSTVTMQRMPLVEVREWGGDRGGVGGWGGAVVVREGWQMRERGQRERGGQRRASVGFGFVGRSRRCPPPPRRRGPLPARPFCGTGAQQVSAP